ncbi:SKN-1 Dependent Zygotic transcript [Caenorhabditis elegans]|uniref:SKN-1 Dependent Zygotic transcript n=1 Tax=Caenorhabditis elegans TaxID=6239 RepID=Q95X89_CAEEL|nr:SKN-1 Dependent Zygotic transcript [Caenorhabditis elegans]CCD64804.1 SKN-1 Dependent Zygotic transcript [Caenorhabditis elegans]|eukprot:NP_494680.1 SKN-1 Dependent Zygotic transcript [Caenorhabditis elegans]
MTSATTTPRTPRLLSSREMQNIEGKLRCLQTLLQNPKTSAIEELKKPVRSLSHNLNTILNLGRTSYKVEVRKRLEGAFKATSELEELVIRVAVGGENIDDVRAQQKSRKL